jgi:hypothetical protein
MASGYEDISKLKKALKDTKRTVTDLDNEKTVLKNLLDEKEYVSPAHHNEKFFLAIISDARARGRFGRYKEKFPA